MDDLPIQPPDRGCPSSVRIRSSQLDHGCHGFPAGTTLNNSTGKSWNLMKRTLESDSSTVSTEVRLAEAAENDGWEETLR